MFLALRSMWEAAATPAVAAQPAGGGPLHACDITMEPHRDYVRIKASFRIGRRVVDPSTVRLLIHDPWGKELELWYPGSPWLIKKKPGVFYCDLDPLSPGVWSCRFDSWGAVETFQIAGMEFTRAASWEVEPVRVGYVLPVDLRIAYL